MKKITLLLLILTSSLRTTASGSDNFNWKLGGRLLLDGMYYISHPDTLNHQANIVDMRLAGKVTFGDWYLKLDMGFAGNKVSPKDAYLQYMKNAHCFRAGYMFGFFSLDQSTSTNDFVFNTGANVAEVFYPGRRIGLSYTRTPKHYYFSVGVFMGDDINLKTNVKQGYNLSGRAVWRPIHEESRLLHIGAAGFFKIPDTDQETGIKSITLKSSGLTYLNSPKYQYLTIRDAQNQIQANAECYFFQNKWMIQTEYMMMRINRSLQAKRYKAQGGYIQAGFLLQGHHFGYDATDAVPVMPTDRNSILVVARYNINRLNDDNAHLYGGNQQDFSVGINYYYNQYLSTRLNYSYVQLDSNAPLGKNDIHLIQARIQIKF